MDVPLTPELEKFVNEKVSSGLYRSPVEVIQEGLRLLKEQDEIKPRQAEGKQGVVLEQKIPTLQHNSQSLRPLGQDRGRFKLPEDFNAPLPEELLAGFENSKL